MFMHSEHASNENTEERIPMSIILFPWSVEFSSGALYALVVSPKLLGGRRNTGVCVSRQPRRRVAISSKLALPRLLCSALTHAGRNMVQVA